MLQIKEREGLWVIRNRFMPGYARADAQAHRPGVRVHDVGRVEYKESDFVNRAGSFLYEPAGSVHTLIVPDDNTEPTDVFFAIWGANLNLDADGNVEIGRRRRADPAAPTTAMCEAAGTTRSPTWCSTEWPTPIELVREFCAAWEKGDYRRLRRVTSPTTRCTTTSRSIR